MTAITAVKCLTQSHVTSVKSHDSTEYRPCCSPLLRMGVELLKPLDATLSSAMTSSFMVGGISAFPNGSQ